VPDRSLLSGGLLLLAALAVAAPSTRESASERLRGIGGLEHRGRRISTGRSLAPACASALAASAAVLLLGWPLGLPAGPAVFIAGRAGLRRLSAHARAPAPMRMSAFATELVAACLDAGATPAAALEAAGADVEAPLGPALTLAAEALSAGATTQEALPETGALAPLAAVFRRSAQTGSAISDQLLGIAAQLRADEQYEKLAKAQRVSVLSALPLGLCMLPAFLLLAVIPAVVGLGTGLLP
jgi:Flp pilus assembly protein TadB